MSNQIKKIILVTGIAVAVFLTGCGRKDDSSNSEEKATKALMIISSMDTFREMLGNAAIESGKEIGMEVDVVTAEGSSDKQVELMKAAEGEGYDIILCNPVDANTALQLEISAGELPIVFFNSCPEENLLEEGKYVYAGSNEADAGKFQAEYVLSNMKDKNEINVAILQGQKGHSATLGRTNAIKDTLAASGKKINYVFSDYGDWDAAKSEELFDIFLKTGNEADAIICNNDAMALGVISSFKKNGIDPSETMILGVDATGDGCQAILDGTMDYTVCQSATGQGKAAIDAAKALLSGTALTEVEYGAKNGLYVWVPFEPVSIDNVKDYQ